MIQLRTKSCECCGKDFCYKSAKAKFCGTVCKQTSLRNKTKAAYPPKIKQCLHCNQEFIPKKKFGTYCCLRCQQMAMRSRKITENDTMISCAICGMKAHNLVSHITRIHKMSVDVYTSIYNTTIHSEKYSTEQSDRVFGDKNPGWQHGGKFSALSANFIHANTTDKAAVIEKISKSNKENGNNDCTMVYWKNQGFTEEQATEKLSERQTTFSLDICIKKHGLKEGTKKWNDRQEKWQTSINCKSKEELERITRAKMCDGRGYSKISQTLFVKLYKIIKDEYPSPHFATINNGVMIDEVDNNHYEWFHIASNGKKMFFDFYIDKIKSIIEFDGDYWHGEKRGNQKRDSERDAILLKDGFRVLHIKERDYRADPTNTIKQCVEFLNG